jgi:hypothetical protein
MRTALLLALVLSPLACHDDGDNGSYCQSDSDCSDGNVCARDESCWPSDDIYSVKITWTIGGQPAGSDTCSQFPDFFVNFYSQVEEFGFAPVPCMAGEFPVDKLPTAYTEVEVGDVNYQFFDETMQIDANGSASFDLAP